MTSSTATIQSTSPTPICPSDDREISGVLIEHSSDTIHPLNITTSAREMESFIGERERDRDRDRERNASDLRSRERIRSNVQEDTEAWEEHMRFQSLEQTISFDGAGHLLDDGTNLTLPPLHSHPHSFPTGRVGSAGGIGTNGGLVPQLPVMRGERGSGARAGSAQWSSGVITVPGVPLSSAAAIALISARQQQEQGQNDGERNGDGEDGDRDGGEAEEEEDDYDCDDRDMSACTNDAIAIEHRFRALRITRSLQGDRGGHGDGMERGEEGGDSIGNHSNEECRYDLIDHTGGSVSPFTLFDDLQMLGDGVMDSLDASLLASPDTSLNGVQGDDRGEPTHTLTPQIVQRDGRTNRMNNTGSTDDRENRIENENEGDNDSDGSASVAESKSILGLGSFDGMLNGSDVSYEGNDGRVDVEREEGGGSTYGSSLDINGEGNESEYESDSDGEEDEDHDMELQRAILRSMGESGYTNDINNSDNFTTTSPNPISLLKSIIINLSFHCYEALNILQRTGGHTDANNTSHAAKYLSFLQLNSEMGEKHKSMEEIKNDCLVDNISIHGSRNTRTNINANTSRNENVYNNANSKLNKNLKRKINPSNIFLENSGEAIKVTFIIWQKIQNLLSESLEIFFTNRERRSLLLEIVRSPCTVMHMLPGVCAGLHRLAHVGYSYDTGDEDRRGFSNENDDVSRNRNKNHINNFKCTSQNINLFNTIFYSVKFDNDGNNIDNDHNNNYNLNNYDHIIDHNDNDHDNDNNDNNDNKYDSNNNDSNNNNKNSKSNTYNKNDNNSNNDNKNNNKNNNSNNSNNSNNNYNNSNNNNNNNNNDDDDDNDHKDKGRYESDSFFAINTPVPNSGSKRFHITNEEREEEEEEEEEETKVEDECKNDNDNVRKINSHSSEDKINISDVILFIECIKNNHLSNNILQILSENDLKSFGPIEIIPFRDSSEINFSQAVTDQNSQINEIFSKKSMISNSLFLILRSIIMPLLMSRNNYFKNGKCKREEHTIRMDQDLDKDQKIEGEEKKRIEREDIHEDCNTSDYILNLLIISIEIDLKAIFKSNIYHTEAFMSQNKCTNNNRNDKAITDENLKSILHSTFSGILLPFLAIIYSHNRETESVKMFLPYALRLLKLFCDLNDDKRKIDMVEFEQAEEVEERERARERVMEIDKNDYENSGVETPSLSGGVLMSWLEGHFKWVSNNYVTLYFIISYFIMLYYIIS